MPLLYLPVGKEKQGVFPDGSVGEESACRAGDPALIPGLGRYAGAGTVYPLQYSWASVVVQLVFSTLVFWPGEFHGRYSPCSCEEWGTTEQLSVSVSLSMRNWSVRA